MQKTTKLWLKLTLAGVFFVAVWYGLYLMFDDYAVYFGGVLAGIVAYLVYHLLEVVFDF